MITNFKIYEVFKKGEWILMTTWWTSFELQPKDLVEFVKNTPAQIVDIRVDQIKSTYTYIAKFNRYFMNSSTKSFNQKTFVVGGQYSWNDYVEYSSTNIDDVFTYIDTKKYNL